MNRTLAIASRETAAFFRLPLGWVVTALFLTLAGALFAGSLEPGAPASLRAFFGLATWAMLFVAPAISMRLVSEELRSGSIEPLMTAPASDWAVVVGKYLGGVAFIVAMLAPTLVYVVTLEAVADPEYGPILAGYLGLLLIGATYVAVGLLASTLTASQTSAFLGTLFFLLLVRFGALQGGALPEPLDQIAYGLSVDLRMDDFGKGVLDTSHVVFFVAVSAVFVTLAVVSLESRRWR